jgi:DNA invertase Pin-like site-specific DNA recombinase
MNSLKPRPPFQVLVMSKESRLGREAIETAYAPKQLVQAGVRVFFYLEDRERTLDTPTDKIMLSLTAFADELEREKARQRTYDAMQRKARAGHVTGGRVFGYDNVEVSGPDGKRSHVIRRINADEAAVVRRIFELCAAGEGLTRITKTLNEDRVAAPRPQQGRPVGWAASSVREVLLRPLYRGEIVWNQTRKRDGWGQSNRRTRTAGEWLRQPAPGLRIVSDDLWNAAKARFAERQSKYTTSGRKRQDIDSPYLLSGFARCGTCGDSLSVASRQHGAGAFGSTAASRSGNVARASAATTSRLAWRCLTRKYWRRCRTTSSGRPSLRKRSAWPSRNCHRDTRKKHGRRLKRNVVQFVSSAIGSPARSSRVDHSRRSSNGSRPRREGSMRSRNRCGSLTRGVSLTSIWKAWKASCGPRSPTGEGSCIATSPRDARSSGRSYLGRCGSRR